MLRLSPLLLAIAALLVCAVSAQLCPLEGHLSSRVDNDVPEVAFFGGSISPVGDLNDDGFADFVIGAASGAVFLVFGGGEAFASSLNVSQLLQEPPSSAAGRALLILPEAPEPQALSGQVADVIGEGDLNGDGTQDIVIGAYGYNHQSGAVYVVFGSAQLAELDPTTMSIQQLIANGQAIRILGEPHSYFGYSLDVVGDVDTDGIDDLLVGAPYGADGGQAFVLFGGSHLEPTSALFAGAGNVTVTDLLAAGDYGFYFEPESSTGNLGRAVSGAGDFNADDYNDMMVSSPLSTPPNAPECEDIPVIQCLFGAGVVYVVYGGPVLSERVQNKAYNLSTLDGSTDGFRFVGRYSGDTIGMALSRAGDLNADGYDDVIVGAPYGQLPGQQPPGSAYIAFGGTDVSGSPDRVLPIDGQRGFRIDGEHPGSKFGISASRLGDITGDGIDDVMIGSHFLGVRIDGRGAAYALFGQTAIGDSGVIKASLLVDPGPRNYGGFRLVGAQQFGYAGTAVAAAGDVDGNGVSDFLVSAPYSEGLRGAIYVGAYCNATVPDVEPELPDGVYRVVVDDSPAIAVTFDATSPSHLIRTKDSCGKYMKDFDVEVKFEEIREVDFYGRFLAAFSFPSQTFTLMTDKITKEVDVYLDEVEQQIGLNFNFRFYKESANISVSAGDNETITFGVDENSNKFTFAISDWPFIAPRSQLQLAFRVKPTAARFEALEQFDVGTDVRRMEWTMTTHKGPMKAVLGLLKAVVIDGALDRNVHIAVEKGDRVVLTFPQFHDSLEYDPDMSVVVDPSVRNKDDCGGEDDTLTLVLVLCLVIVPVVVFASVAVASVGFFLLRKRRTAMSRKLTHMILSDSDRAPADIAMPDL